MLLLWRRWKEAVAEHQKRRFCIINRNVAGGAQPLSRVRLFAIPWTVVYQAPLSMGFLRQEYQSGLPFPSPENIPNPEIEPSSPGLAGKFFTTEPPGKPNFLSIMS